MLRLGAICFILCLALTYVPAQLLIDDFENPVAVTANLTVQTNTETTLAAGIIGGERRTTARLLGSQNAMVRIGCFVRDIAQGSFVLSADVSVTGNCNLLYPLPMPTDFVNGPACDCWLTRATNSDAISRVSFVVITNTGTFTSNVFLPNDISIFNQLDLCLPFDIPNIQAYAETNAITIQAQPLRAGGDIELTYTCCAPSVSCWHSVTVPNNPAVAGDTARISFSCQNYISIPASVQSIMASFPFPQAIGTIQAPSVICTRGLPVINNNAVEVTVPTLAENETVTCDFDVLLTGAGDTGDLRANVMNLIAGTLIRSGIGGNRAGTRAFCDPPVAESLQVINAPTTLAPTTEPPTTEPPTTAPPTTEPPTTRPPTTEPPTTQPPTTEPPTTQPPTTQPPTTLPPTTLPPVTPPPTTAPPTTLPPTTEPPTTRAPTTQPPTTEPPTTEPPTTAPPTTEPPTTEPPTTLAPTTLPPTTEAPTRPCPPFTTDPPATECYRLRNHPGAIQRPPDYCLRLDALSPGDVVTFDCDTGNGLYLRVDPMADTVRIFGNITGGVDTGDAVPNPLNLDVDITYNGLNFTGISPNIAILITEESLGFLRFDGEEYILMGKRDEDTGISLGLLRPYLGVVDMFSLFGWVAIARPGGPFNTQFINDFQGTIGECILCEDIDLGGGMGVPIQPTDAPTTVAPPPTATPNPTAAPTRAPTAAPTRSPTIAPAAGTSAPTPNPTAAPTRAPTVAPTAAPTRAPTAAPTAAPTRAPTAAPTASPTAAPVAMPTASPSGCPLQSEPCASSCNRFCDQCFFGCQCGSCNFADPSCMTINSDMPGNVQVPASGCLIIDFGVTIGGSILGTGGSDCVLVSDVATVSGTIDLEAGNDCLMANVAQIADVNGGDGSDCIQLDQTQVGDVNLGSGNNCLTLTNSNGGSFTSGDQDDCILAQTGGEYGSVRTGAGDDIVRLALTITVTTVDLSSGDDCIEVALARAGQINLGAGADSLVLSQGLSMAVNGGSDQSCMRMTDFSTAQSITGSTGVDNVLVSSSTIEQNIDLRGGNDFLVIDGNAGTRSAVSGGNILGGAGVDSLVVSDCNTETIQGGADNDCLEARNNLAQTSTTVTVDGSAGNDVCSSDNTGTFANCETTNSL